MTFLEYKQNQDPNYILIGFIYMTENTATETIMRYVGKAIGKKFKLPSKSSPEGKGRIRTHWRLSLKKKNNSCIFDRALHKYGWQAFEWHLLEKVYAHKDSTEKERVELIRQREQYWMDVYKTLNRKYGYNLREAGSKGKHAEDSKKKQSKSIKKWWKNSDNKIRMKKIIKEEMNKPETIKKMSEIKRKWYRNPQNKESMSGINHPNSISFNKRIRLKRLYETGDFTTRELARKANVSQSTICNIVNESLS